MNSYSLATAIAILILLALEDVSFAMPFPPTASLYLLSAPAHINPISPANLSNQTSSTQLISQPIESLIKSEQVQCLIQQARDAWVNGDADTFVSLFTPDGEFIVPGSRSRGAAEIRAVFWQFAIAHTDVEIDIRRLLIDGNQAMVEWHWQDTEIATGDRTDADDAIVVDFRAGQISRWREYIDTQSRKAQPEASLRKLAQNS